MPSQRQPLRGTQTPLYKMAYNELLNLSKGEEDIQLQSGNCKVPLKVLRVMSTDYFTGIVWDRVLRFYINL